MKVNHLGDTIWTKSIDFVSSDLHMVDILEYSPTEFYGLSWNYTNPYDGFLLLKFDQNGDTLWTKQFFEPGYDLNPTQILIEDQKLYIVSSAENTSLGFNNAKPKLYVTDLNGQILADTLFGTGVNSFSPFKAKFDKDTNIVMIGDAYGPSFDSDASIYRVSTSLDSLYHYHHPRPNEQTAFSFDFSSNGIVIFGWEKLPGSAYDYYLLRTDSSLNVSSSTIKGTVFNDINGNQIQDTLENGLKDIIVESGYNITSTDSMGHYSLTVYDTVTADVTATKPTYWTQTTPSSSAHIVQVDSFYVVYDSIDFGEQMIPNILDISIDIAGTSPSPGFSSSYWITVHNNATDTASGILEFVQFNTWIVNNLLFDNAEFTYSGQSGDTLTWSFMDLLPGEMRTIQVLGTTPANISLLGDTVTLYGYVAPVLGDTIPQNNYDTLYQIVTGAYDPNNKVFFPSFSDSVGVVPVGTEYVDFQINFQNTGTDTAHNIFLLDTISSLLKLNSLEILGSSHNMTWQILAPRVLRFDFDNIDLVDSNTNEILSHGFVKFRIDLIDSINLYDLIVNQAGIYFDYNPPILTNDALIFYGKTPTFISQSICYGDSVYLGGAYQNTIGDYTDTLIGFDGSDSLIVTTLTLKPIFSQIDSAEICAGSNYVFPDGFTSDTSITYTSFLTTIQGCDSLIITTLSVTNINDQITQNGHTLTGPVGADTYQWLDCDNGYTPITDSTFVSFTATANGSYAVEINSLGCIDTSECIIINDVGVRGEVWNGFSVYPNPTAGEITVNIGSTNSATITILNMLGEVIYTSKQIVPVASYAIAGSSGTYFLSIQSNTAQYTYRIFKR